MNEEYDRAFTALQLKQYEVCQRYVMAGLRLDPNNSDLLWLLGHVELQTEHYAAARDLGQQVISLSPESSSGYDLCARAILSDPIYLAGATPKEAANADVGKRRFREARRLVKTTLELAPENASHHGMLAEVELMERKHDQAIQAADAALALDPMHDHANLVRIRALAAQKHLDQAIENCLRCLSYDAENSQVHHQIAGIYLEQKRFLAASAHARQAIRLEPDNDEFADTYWCTVHAGHLIFRPFVYWHLTIRRILRWSPEGRIIGFITLSILSTAAAFAAKHYFGTDAGLMLAVILAAMLPFLFTEDRWPMALADLLMFVGNRKFRLVANRHRIMFEAVITGAIAMVVMPFVCCAFGFFAPLIILVCAAIFAIPVVTFFRVQSPMGRALLVGKTFVMAYLLYCSVTTFQVSRNSSPERTQAIHFAIGFGVLSLFGPALHDHFQRNKSDATPDTNASKESDRRRRQ